jgi:mRNA-degrading endonuclease toxin of MazEF toxin-antitoxin module
MHQAQMAVTCPMTTKLRARWPFRLRVTRNGKANDIMADQIRAVSLERFGAFIEVLAADDVQYLKDIIAQMYTV